MKRLKILIVDDEMQLLSMLGELCEGQSWETFLANDGLTGLAILNQKSIDLAVVDLCLPKLDGLGVLRQVRKERIQTPIIIISGYGTLKMGTEVMRAGAIDVLDKPFTKHEFIEKILLYTSNIPSWPMRLEAFIENHCNDPKLKFEDVMRHFHFSKSYGCNLFRIQLGITFRRFLVMKRLEKSKDLMTGQSSLSEIADQCGFSSLASFSKVFKKEFHCSPKEYRRKCTNEQILDKKTNFSD